MRFDSPMTRAFFVVLLLSVCGGLSACGGRDRTSIDGAVRRDGGGVVGDAGPRPDGFVPSPDAGPPVMPGEWVDPSCVDGMYSEPLPNPDASIADLLGTFSSADPHAFVNGVLMRRYPIGQGIVERGLANTRLGDCVELFIGSPSSGQDAARQLSTVVHECGHFADLGSGFGSSYVIRPDLVIECNGGDTEERGGNTFARSRMNGDDQASMRPDDFYRDVYLDGDPDNGSFEGGDQGFNSVLEEATQYVNSLATGYAFNDQYAFTVSERDGILTFLWYIERYLRLARTSFPSAYAFISGDACWRNLILTIWGRAWIYLEATADIPTLGIDDDALFALVTNPVLLEEIQRIRDAHGCP
jgi:hypothetical protein